MQNSCLVLSCCSAVPSSCDYTVVIGQDDMSHIRSIVPSFLVSKVCPLE